MAAMNKIEHLKNHVLSYFSITGMESLKTIPNPKYLVYYCFSFSFSFFKYVSVY
uniref:Uncharacterized protein n=1 Tax=Rhizophora mucronata TaxID=61149 RepID=A0A2P2PAC1_RHIMU